jgi:hypothetical protein
LGIAVFPAISDRAYARPAHSQAQFPERAHVRHCDPGLEPEKQSMVRQAHHDVILSVSKDMDRRGGGACPPAVLRATGAASRSRPKTMRFHLSRNDSERSSAAFVRSTSRSYFIMLTRRRRSGSRPPWYGGCQCGDRKLRNGVTSGGERPDGLEPPGSHARSG